MIWYHPSTSPPSWPACRFIKICHRLTNWLTLALIGLPRSQKWTPRYVQMKIYYFIFTYFLASCPCKLALWQKSNLDFWQDRRLHIQKSQILTRIKMWNEKLKRLYCVLNLYDVLSCMWALMLKRWSGCKEFYIPYHWWLYWTVVSLTCMDDQVCSLSM